MIGGIDQQIQQKVDAYRGNPQQLMQRYQQNQELIDLLALQKLKSEKDAAAREMQMQMQTTPQTIKQQREAELLQMTKDDMVKQTSGIMQERQKRQQQNMQRTANQGLPQLPAGNMQRMAGGGIVAFAEGGPLRQEDVDAKLRQQIELALQLGESPEALAERLKDNPNALAILRSAIQKAPERAPRELMSPRLQSEAGMMTGPLAAPPTPKEAQEGPMLGMPTRDQARQADQSRLERIRGKLSPSLGSIDTEQLVRDMGVTPLSEKPDAVTSAARPVPERKPTTPDRFGGVGLFGGERAPVTTTPREGGGIGEILRQMQESAAKTPGGPVSEAVQTNRGLRGKEGLGGLYEETKRTPTAPTQTPAQAPAEVEQLEEIDLSKIPERKKLPAEPTPSSRYEDLRKRLERTLEEQQDPEKLRKERLRDFLIGAGGRSSFGSVMAGGAAAAANRQRIQEAQKLKGIESLMGTDLETMKLDVDREANQALQELRQGQMNIQKFNAVASSFQDLQDRIDAELSMNREYTDAQTAYAEALDDGDREAMKRALQRIDEIRNRVIRGMPNYLTLQDTLKKMSARFAGAEGDTTTAPIDLTQYSVREKPQQ